MTPSRNPKTRSYSEDLSENLHRLFGLLICLFRVPILTRMREALVLTITVICEFFCGIDFPGLIGPGSLILFFESPANMIIGQSVLLPHAYLVIYWPRTSSISYALCFLGSPS